MKHFIRAVITSLLLVCALVNFASAASPSNNSQNEIKFQKAVSLLKNGNRDVAVWAFTELAEQGHVESQYELASIYFKERGGPGGKQRDAFKWYKLASELGHAKAQHKLGLMYSIGLVGAKSTGQTIRWYESAAKKGVVAAQYDLGVYYANHNSRNYTYAYAWLYLAAKNGHSSASNKLKKLLPFMAPHQISDAIFLSGSIAQINGPASDLTELISWDFSSGMKAFGKEDFTRAFSIFYPYAQNGYPAAEYFVGAMYGTGKGAPLDYPKSFEWIEKSAQHGFTKAQLILVGMLAKGRRAPKNVSKAMSWLYIVELEGNRGTSDLIASLSLSLNSKEIKAAKRTAKEWVLSNKKAKFKRTPGNPKRPKL